MSVLIGEVGGNGFLGFDAGLEVVYYNWDL